MKFNHVTSHKPNPFKRKEKQMPQPKDMFSRGTKMRIKFDDILIDALAEELLKDRLSIEGDLALPQYLFEQTTELVDIYLQQLQKEKEENTHDNV